MASVTRLCVYIYKEREIENTTQFIYLIPPFLTVAALH